MEGWLGDAKVWALVIWSVIQTAILLTRSVEQSRVITEMLEWRRTFLPEWSQWRGRVDEQVRSHHEAIQRIQDNGR